MTNIFKIKTYLIDHYKMDLRDDSRIIWKYPCEKEEELKYVCKNIWFAKLLHEYSDYKKMCDSKLKSEQYKLMNGHEGHPLAYQQSWEHIQSYYLFSLQISQMSQLIQKMKQVDENGNIKK
jgi:hypothetical protein